MEKEIIIDVDDLREDLIDYFGTGMFNASPAMMIMLEKVKSASDMEVVDIAIKNGFDIRKYEVNPFGTKSIKEHELLTLMFFFR